MRMAMIYDISTASLTNVIFKMEKRITKLKKVIIISICLSYDDRRIYGAKANGLLIDVPALHRSANWLFEYEYGH